MPTTRQLRFASIHGRPAWVIQPVTQTSVKAQAPEDLGLLGSRSPRYGGRVDPCAFMRQAGLCAATYANNDLICRESGDVAAASPLRCPHLPLGYEGSTADAPGWYADCAAP
jgi:hypothetical protein